MLLIMTPNRKKKSLHRVLMYFTKKRHLRICGEREGGVVILICNSYPTDDVHYYKTDTKKDNNKKYKKAN